MKSRFIQGAVVRALKHAACSLGHIALGNAKAAALHGKAASAYTALTLAAQAALVAGVPVWMVDSISHGYDPIDDTDYAVDELN